MRYVALLRGINVGGKNKVDMAGLRTVFESAGMTEVATYINSGNVIFSTEATERDALTATIERAIADGFGFSVDALVKSADEIKAIAAALPADWVNDGSMKCDVLYLWPEIDRESILSELDFRPQIEDVRYTPGAVVWRVDRANATKSRLPRVVGSPVYKQMTIRNCNTARKLAELAAR